MHSWLDPGRSLWVALAIGGLIGVLFLRAWLNFRSIPRLRAESRDTPPPDCMVVIPARDEERLIAAAVASFPQDTVIVVDDHSGDRTAEAARKAGAGVLPAPDLPRGAFGKANACLAGARVLTSRWILFTDADTTFEPGFLNAAVAAAEAGGVALLSVILKPRGETWWQRLTSPLAVALFFCGVSPRRDPAAAFSGQCLLVRRDAYEFLGGHSAVLNTVAEDVKLAALARRHRLTYGMARAGRLGEARERDLSGRIERASFRFLLAGSWTGILILTAATVMALWAPVLAWLVADRHWIAAGIFAMVPTLAALPWYGSAGALLARPAIYAVAPMIWKAFFAALGGRRIQWKGRVI